MVRPPLRTSALPLAAAKAEERVEQMMRHSKAEARRLQASGAQGGRKARFFYAMEPPSASRASAPALPFLKPVPQQQTALGIRMAAV